MKQRQTLRGYINETSSFSRVTPSGTYVNETSVPPPATQYGVTGPTTGTATIASEPFTATTNGPSTALVTVSDGGQGGTFSPSATFAADGGTFRYIADSSGTKTLTFTNNGGLVDPSPLTFEAAVYVAPPSVTLVSQTPPDGQNVVFTVNTSNADTISIVLQPSAQGADPLPTRTYSAIGGVQSITYDAIPPETYTVLITATSENGTDTVSGNTFTIAGVGGGGEITLRVPGVPTNVVAAAGDGYVDVTFSPPADAGSDPITEYVVTLSTGETATGTASPVRVGASNGVSRTANVKARNGAGYSDPSLESNEVTPFGQYVPKITFTFVNIAEGLTLSAAWFDQSNPIEFLAPSWTGQVTSSSGQMVINLPGSQLTVGNTGWLIITDSDGDPATIHRAFSGPVVVQ